MLRGIAVCELRVLRLDGERVSHWSGYDMLIAGRRLCEKDRD